MALVCVDTSIVVAAFASWHERHDQALVALDEDPGVPFHAALESYSVLTRLPPPLRMPAGVVLDFLDAEFPPAARLTLDRRAQRAAVNRLGRAGISGGAVYDGLIALTAAAADATLLSFDQRAIRTYERLGAATRLLGA